jgi:hypothetical protein
MKMPEVRVVSGHTTDLTVSREEEVRALRIGRLRRLLKVVTSTSTMEVFSRPCDHSLDNIFATILEQTLFRVAKIITFVEVAKNPLLGVIVKITIQNSILI